MISPKVAYLRTLLTEVKRVHGISPSYLHWARPKPKCGFLLALGRGRILSLINLISTKFLSLRPSRDSLLHDTNNYGILSRWQSSQLCLLHLRDVFPYLSFRGSRRDPWTRPITPSIKRPLPIMQRYAEHTLQLSPELSFTCCHRLGLISTPEGFGAALPRLFIFVRLCSLAPSVGTTVSRSSMHLRSRYLPRPSASSPPDNRAHPMANPDQIPDLEGFHREIHDMAKQMRIMNENNGGGGAEHRVRPYVKGVPLQNLVKLQPGREGGRSPHRGNQIKTRNKSTSQKIRDLDARLDAINTEANVPVTVDTLIRQTEPPFTERVLRARISSKFKLPAQLGIYEGKTYPMDHLDSYKSLMSLQGCSDEVMCKAFSTTLKGPARSWFRKLSPGTIDSFGDLSRLFVTNFMSCRHRQKNASHLFTVHQKEIESLKDFVKRFNQAILEVENPSDKVSKADKYIAAEELAEAKRRRRGKDDHKRKEPDTRRVDYKEETRNKRLDRDSKCSNDRHPRTPPRCPEFILPPLNAPVAQVLSKIKHEEFIKWPGKINTDPQKRNQNKYCEFHRDHGHNTEDCFQLKEQIADLIKRGYLRKYVVTRPPPNSPEKRYGDNKPTAGDIQMIHGGFGSGGCLTSSRKKHARSALRLAEEEIYNFSSSYVGDQTPITFSNDDLRGLHLPHNDALVVSAVIANFNVQRILIDNGSLADILFISAFKRMKIGLDKLHPFHTPLIRFGRNTTHPLEWINLPITLGTEPHQITVWQDFIVVDCPSPYNAILGRPNLGGIKAITSTYHLKLKFPTPTGIGEIKGDQKVARQCFISAMKIKMYLPDIEKTSFITKRGLYCYKVMPFGLNNAGATYQRLVNRMFKEQIRKTMEVYIDDMLVKSLRSSDHIAHLEEAFGILRHHRMMLNPSKCIFGVSSGKFLGFLVTKRGIKVNPDQIKALIAMNSPRNVREVQQLTGRVAALNRFVSKSADKCLPFFKILRKKPRLVIQTPSGEQMEYAIRIRFKATNNEAEYEALLAGLIVVVELRAQSLENFSDSQLVVNQVQGDYLAKDARMMAYLGEVKAASAKIKEFKINQIPREDNKKADALANLASTFEFVSDRCIPLEFLASPSIGVANQILQTEERPLLKCLRLEEAEYVLKEIHEGICGNHSGARSLARKTIRQGYFWPTIEQDVATYIRRCDKCQRFAPVSRLPHTEMVPMSSPWPFAQWEIDILGPLPRTPLQRKFLIVAIDYFTKWIEAQPLAKITEKNTRDFVWKHLVCRFKIPKVITSDNARQFDNDKFKLFCSDLAISHHFSSPGHPQANGQVEVTNRTILRNLKASRIPTGQTPYSMVFGTESVIPVEIGMPSFRTSNFDKESNEAELRLNLNLLEERREKAKLCQAAYKCQVAKYYNQRVKHRSFLPGDLVLRRVTLSTKEPNARKLGPTWEGPYKVIKVSRPGTYWLEDPNGKTLLHP
ncbi:hypothetical protein Acr_06g0008550 [Actinidia rufa]|uniref:Integrase catalytic domain-containing protein n=1 Tax=Actinidia rufa TaxID=165716 RepID=A0A7J0ER07_9ERIC|nr:hypothetical protein Acr_06g0008550 [Actinidia rufa]